MEQEVVAESCHEVKVVPLEPVPVVAPESNSTLLVVGVGKFRIPDFDKYQTEYVLVPGIEQSLLGHAFVLHSSLVYLDLDVL